MKNNNMNKTLIALVGGILLGAGAVMLWLMMVSGDVTEATALMVSLYLKHTSYMAMSAVLLLVGLGCSAFALLSGKKEEPKNFEP